MSTVTEIIEDGSALPALLGSIDPRAIDVMNSFFRSELRSEKTRRAYKTGCADFFRCTLPRIPTGDLASIHAMHVSDWLDDMTTRCLSPPTIKQRLAGLRKLFMALARERIIDSNPVSLVAGPRYSVRGGKTPVLDGEETRHLLESIDTSTLIGLRDRAMIATMAYSFARISAVTGLRVSDLFIQKKRLWLRLSEKNGQCKDVPCHHLLEEYLTEWIEAAELTDAHYLLFPTFTWPEPKKSGDDAAPGEDEAEDGAKRQRVMSNKPMTQPMTWEMVQRHRRRAGIATAICNHTFRATGITAFLSNGGTIERAAHIAGHASTRTTQLYDRRPDDITLDEIEKIRFG